MACKVLIISNNCLSRYNSNGRTLLNLLGEFQNSELYQFYIANEEPTEGFCSKFLRITDRDVLKSFGFAKRHFMIWDWELIKQGNIENLTGKKVNYGKKTVAKSFVRDFIWGASAWVANELENFIHNNGINVIVLQAGDNVFLHKLARKVSRKSGRPLIIYNTEDYYFKDYNYIKGTLKCDCLYKFYHHGFCKEFERLIRCSSAEVYNCIGLQKIYNSTFKKNGVSIYAATTFQAVENVNKEGLISYTGNLSCGRHKVLMEVANSLQSISDKLYLDVYGPCDEKVLKDFQDCQGIRYHGFVSYQEVCRVMSASRLLVHVESFEPYYKRDTRFAFSTKLADYGASNIPVFICAPSTSETYDYMTEHEIAFVAKDSSEIESKLREALFNEEERKLKSERALQLSKKNNNYQINGRLFRNVVEGIINATE